MEDPVLALWVRHCRQGPGRGSRSSTSGGRAGKRYRAGVWVRAQVLGSKNEEAKKAAQKFFKSKKAYIHICQLDSGGVCKEEHQAALHLGSFHGSPQAISRPLG